MDIRIEGETIWLTQAQMAELFQTTLQNVTVHLKAIYQEGFLKIKRALKYYSLEPVLAVGYCIKSNRGTQF
jgi:hypothetical protein